MKQMKQNINILLKNLSKDKFLIKENGLENLEDPKALTEYSNNMQNVYNNIEEYNPNRKRIIDKKRKAFDDMIAGIIDNKKT